jgi:predicted LPLAT superfamily acyltransferase
MGNNRIARVNFLDEPAPFPEGPFRLSMVTQLPFVLTIALKTGPNRYEIFMEEVAGGEPAPAVERT